MANVLNFLEKIFRCIAPLNAPLNPLHGVSPWDLLCAIPWRIPLESLFMSSLLYMCNPPPLARFLHVLDLLDKLSWVMLCMRVSYVCPCRDHDTWFCSAPIQT
jgi:hypothetical protein